MSESIRNLRELTERLCEQEARERFVLRVMQELTTILLMYTNEAMCNEVLGVMLRALKSKYGVFGYIDPQGSLVCPSMATQGVWEKCAVENKTAVFPRENWGDSAWCRVLRGETETVCSNAGSKVPDGHIPITRHITAAISHEGQAIGLLQVANKASDYEAWDVGLVETIAERVGPILAVKLQKARVDALREK